MRNIPPKKHSFSRALHKISGKITTADRIRNDYRTINNSSHEKVSNRQFYSKVTSTAVLDFSPSIIIVITIVFRISNSFTV